MPAASYSDLGKQSVSAVKWSVFGTLVRFGLQLAAQIVLARLLGPEIYGLFAIGLVVLTFSNFVADFGFAWGLAQTQNLGEDDVRFAFTWQLMAGLSVAGVVYFCAPTIAGFFNEARVVDIIRWLSLACVINAIAAPATNLLRRNLDFRALSIIQVVSYAFGYLAIGIPLASFGAGVWSLVSAWLAQAICCLVLTFIRRPHSIKLSFWYGGAPVLSWMGLTVFATNICNWLLNNLDRILLGRLLNAESVGLYVAGYNLATTPNSLLLGALQPAFLTAGARIQTEAALLRRAYLSVIATIWILVTPLFALLAVVAADLVAVLYGPAWEASGKVLAILALSMPAYVTWGMSTPILWNTGRKHLESLLQLPIIVAAILAFYWCSSRGVLVAALVAGGVLFVRAVVVTTAACLRLEIGLDDLREFALRGLAMLLLAAISGYTGLELGRMAGATHASALLGGAGFGCLVLLTMSFVFPQQLLGTVAAEMLARFSPTLIRFLDRSARART